MPRVRVGGVHLYREILAESDLLAMIPGFAIGGRAGCFRQSAGLAEHCRVIAIDSGGWQPSMIDS